MVTAAHVSASLRILNADDSHVRTFTGVRRNITQINVNDLLNGINSVRERQVTKALHTVRAQLLADN